MHVARIVRRYKNKTYVTTLLRTSYRDGPRVRHRTLANLSHLPDPVVDLVRRSLQGEAFTAASDLIHTRTTRPHGHVHAVLGTMRRLGMDSLVAATPSRQRNLVLGLIAERLLFPCSKLAVTRHWLSTTLATELGVADADDKELYQALDWLLQRQPAIEAKMAQRHFAADGLALYDVSSSFYHGRTCPLAHFGHSRDGKKGMPIIVYGLLTDRDGRPVAIQVYPGYTADPKTVPDQVRTLRDRFGLRRVVLVGDRGMLTQPQVDRLRQESSFGWISALTSKTIRQLVDTGALPLEQFDTVHVAEIESLDFPDERLIACYNPQLAERRHQKRAALLAKTEEALQQLARAVARRRNQPWTREEIGVKAGRRVNRWKMAKHFRLTIGDGYFAWERRTTAMEAEQALDGIYVIRTSEKQQQLSAANGVRHYKRLTQVERAFRTWKGLDVLVWPIFHRMPPRLRAHMFLCLLAYYVAWEMRRAWAPLLYADEEVEVDREERDPVLAAEASASAKAKKSSHQTSAGWPAHSFRTLLADLGSQGRVTYRIGDGDEAPTYEQVAEPTVLQAEAMRLLGL